MRSTYGSSQRERSRQRTRQGPYSMTRETSPDDPYHRNYSPHQFAKKKRVKFNDDEDIRVFRKQDEPIARSLSEDEILQIKNQIEKEVSRIYDFNWDQKKHFDALSEQNSMKEQKQKQKQLYEKLMGMKEQTEFYSPYSLALPTNSGVPISGSQSIEKQAHSERIRDVLGCYYTQINQIPNEPVFEVIPQNAKNLPKAIFFTPGGLNQGDQFVRSSNLFPNPAKNNEKQIKGILKIPGQTKNTSVPKKSIERQISPRLLWLLKDMQVNKQKYNKQMRQMILKPYKDSGELDFWMTNVEALNEKLKNQPVGVPAPPSEIPVVINPPPVQHMPQFSGPQRISPSPTHEFRPHFNQPYDPMQKAQKFKTVPCKYFHGPQGCVKTQNCTFIHDEQYRGVSHPLMLRPQYSQFPNSGFGNRGFQDNPNFQNRRDNFNNFGGGFRGHHDSHHQGGFHNKPFHHGPRKFDNYQQGGGYQGGYNQQQPRPYQNYGHQAGQQGQMNQPNYPSMNPQMAPQMNQPQQPMPGYQGYPNSGQQQPMYYGQGQMGNMQQRNPNQK